MTLPHDMTRPSMLRVTLSNNIFDSPFSSCADESVTYGEEGTMSARPTECGHFEPESALASLFYWSRGATPQTCVARRCKCRTCCLRSPWRILVWTAQIRKRSDPTRLPPKRRPVPTVVRYFWVPALFERSFTDETFLFFFFLLLTVLFFLFLFIFGRRCLLGFFLLLSFGRRCPCVFGHPLTFQLGSCVIHRR